ncbi:hypothetical protein [Vibrio fluvialis]|uniref:hypothetical protein n=1 Tax=Vibrio fluvialis TaxID=676 RepID=UPI00192C35DD|nr:hypothetical protein [Vibrio fluvialis]MBL4240706.1 hypothetical protein [Vibrio fluvialis]MBL4267397.1 hypothetical protein [Vibrio fluvialis]MBL4271802.1 hypothetical protein [Vibrio fluvialis]MBL4276164.1 hypothetical protein [Vibrio fluvialis]MBO1443060.1 hypothetical protein [Vibrio fluvialis]
MRSEQGTELGYQQTRYQHFDAPGQNNQLLLRAGYKFDQKEHLDFGKNTLSSERRARLSTDYTALPASDSVQLEYLKTKGYRLVNW